MRFLRGNDRNPDRQSFQRDIGQAFPARRQHENIGACHCRGQRRREPGKSHALPKSESFDAPFEIAAIGADAVDRQPGVGRKSRHQFDQAIEAFLFGQSPGADQDKPFARRAVRRGGAKAQRCFVDGIAENHSPCPRRRDQRQAPRRWKRSAR